jgi:hypothetical protein
MTGHLFLTRGDLRHLACDAILVPSGAWDGRLGHVGNPLWHDVALPLLEGDFVDPAPTHRRRAVEVVPRRSTQAPAVWVGHTGDDRRRDATWYADGLAAFVRAASARVGSRYDDDVRARPLGDPRPLLAVPLVGTGQGGMAHAKGEVVNAVVAALIEAADDSDADVALVLFDEEAHAAAQQVRLRLRGDDAWSDIEDLMESARHLARRVRSGQVVLFLGAGVSMGAGLPSWADLLRRLAGGKVAESELEALLTIDARDAAAVLERRYGGREALADAVVEEMSTERVSLAHQLLASLPVREAVTTNYDVLFERAWHDVGRRPRVLPRESAQGADTWLLKLHGSVDDRARIVLSRDDYLRFEGHGVALAGVVQAMLLTRHMLFVGYSLSDDNFHRLMHQVRSAVGSRAQRPGDERFGTALLTAASELQHEVWEDDVALVTTSADGGAGPRRLAMLLDRMNAEAAAPAAHMLDASYDSLFGPHEEILRDALLDAWAAARQADIPRPVRAAVEQALRMVGPPPTDSTLTHRRPGCGKREARPQD